MNEGAARQKMGAAAKTMAHTDAAGSIAQIAARLAGATETKIPETAAAH